MKEDSLYHQWTEDHRRTTPPDDLVDKVMAQIKDSPQAPDVRIQAAWWRVAQHPLTHAALICLATLAGMIRTATVLAAIVDLK